MKDISNFPIHLISDTHYDHFNSIGYCNRPFHGVKQMNQKLIANWNKEVKDEDVVYHLGDIGLDKAAHEFISQLKGQKYLILGNHDRLSVGAYYKMGFKGVYTSLDFKYKGLKIHLSHHPKAFGFLKFKLLFRSFLDVIGFKFAKNWLRWIKNPLLTESTWHCHGHVHKNTPQLDIKNKMVNCCVDCWDYKPVSLDIVISMIQRSGRCQK